MTEYLIYFNEIDAQECINSIDESAGFPNENTLTWGTPLVFYNSPNTDDVVSGFAVVVLPEIYSCLTEQQMLDKNILPTQYTFSPKNYPSY